MSAKQKYNTLWKRVKRNQQKSDLSHVDNIDTSSTSLESFSDPLQHAQPIEGMQSEFECDVEMQGLMQILILLILIQVLMMQTWVTGLL